MNLPSPLRAAVCGTAAWLVALTLGACGGTGAAPVARVGTATVAAHTGTSRSPVTAVATAAAPTQAPMSPALGRLRRVLNANVQRLGSAGVGLLVEDLSTHQLLVSHDGDVARPPASVEKLYTSLALLWDLGPAFRLHTELLGRGHLAADGTWVGDLYLRGDGDPTFGDGGWNHIYEAGQGPTVAQLVAELRRTGIRRVSGRLYGDPFRLDSAEGGPATDNAPDPGDYGGEMSALVYDHGLTLPHLGPAASAVHEVALVARGSGIRLRPAPHPARTPAGAVLLARLASPPLGTLLPLMNVPSDDLFADLFAKQLGLIRFGRGTLGLGALAIRQAVSGHLGLDPIIFDGSGLDRADRSSPTQVLALLADVAGTPVGDRLVASLPVLGRSGTVAGIGLKTPAVGRCAAKTGTLDNVTNLAGYCRARDGHRLAFVFMVDGPANWQSLAAFTPMAGAVAAY